jgi:two-component system CheB/CheR fusion protein
MRQKKQDDRAHQDDLLLEQPLQTGAGWEGLCGVVAVGASAGGLEAFSRFLKQVPTKSGLAFILIQHLDPSVPSQLSELLARIAPIPVVEAAEGTRIEPDHAYVIPPGNNMAIRGRTLRLQEQRGHPGLYHSIDVFFRSLADDAKERTVAVILSGTGTDGVDGARAVKVQQGLIVVQDPETAQYSGMPRAAIDAGVEDYVLAPEAMAERLVEYFRHSCDQREEIRQALQKDDAGLKNILSLVRARTGRDFFGYKPSSLTRRIERRMAVDQIETVGNYLRFLQEHPVAVESLVKDLLINVTSFFRDPEAFAALKNAICEMLQDRPEGSQIRAWSAGCSTGEEAYSLAMLLMECAEELGRRLDLQIFGTDLDAEAIAVARAGVYPPSIAQNVSRPRLDKFFNLVDSSYRIKPDIRERHVFAVHDLVRDPPYSRMDLVSVRNLLIYFDSKLQKQILPLLHYALNEGGLLFLGTAESIGDSTDLFVAVDKKWRVYRCINRNREGPARVPGSPGQRQAVQLDAQVGLFKGSADTSTLAAQVLLLEALPPSVLVDRQDHVIYSHGNTARYLQLPEGKPDMNLLLMANASLRGTLAGSLQEARQEQKEVVKEGLRLRVDGIPQSVKVTVRFLRHAEGNLIVTFEDTRRPKRRQPPGEPARTAEPKELEQELQLTRETLRGTIEELEAANEELQSANEEFMSTNEELRSSNEELETSREELQSVNEELVTINTEYQKKNEDLTIAHDDMKNLLNSTDIATIFLGENLEIRRFTPAATRLFNFIDSDLGRPIQDITSRLQMDSLARAARQVLDSLVPAQQEVQTREGYWYTMRIHPYRTSYNNIDGVVVSFTDIQQIKTASLYTQSIVDTIREPVLVLDEALRVISAGRAFYETFHVRREETEGRIIYELGSRQWDIPQLRELLRDILEKDSVFDGYRVKHDFPGIGPRVMLLNARRVHDETGAANRILLALEDVTGRRGPESFSAGPADKEVARE